MESGTLRFAYTWFHQQHYSISVRPPEIRATYWVRFLGWHWSTLRIIAQKRDWRIFQFYVGSIYGWNLESAFIDVLSGLSVLDAVFANPEITKTQFTAYDKLRSELQLRSTKIFTNEELTEALDKLEELSRLYKQLTGRDFPNTFRKDLQKAYLFNTFRLYMFLFGAFLLYRREFEMLGYWWHYRQPPDSRALWVGKDVLPYTAAEIFHVFFHQETILTWIDQRWEDRHDPFLYFQEYVIASLGRAHNILSIAGEPLIEVRDIFADFDSERIGILIRHLEKLKKWVPRFFDKYGGLVEHISLQSSEELNYPEMIESLIDTAINEGRRQLKENGDFQ